MDSLDERVSEYKIGTLIRGIGLCVGVAGCTFDYGLVDEAMKFTGGAVTGATLKDSLNYLFYLMRQGYLF